MDRKQNPYVDSLVGEWGPWHRRDVRDCVFAILAELSAEALLGLRRNPKLEVIRSPEGDSSVWAYFPVNRRRTIARKHRPRTDTRVLIVINETLLAGQPLERSKAELRDHLGHALLYLRSPRARNECTDADREFRASKQHMRN